MAVYMSRLFRISAPSMLGTQLILFLALAMFLFDFRIYPYADDWIFTAPLGMDNAQQFISWVFAQHVDHRIPLQKALQFWLAENFGFDFRILVLVNVFLAFVTSLALTSAAKLYRGHQHVGDLIIPLILLMPTEAYSLWAFEMQFLSSVFFAAVAMYFACKYCVTQRDRYLGLMLLQLFLCAWCGMNGSIFSLVLLFGLFAHWWHGYRRQCKPSRWLITAAGVVLFQNIIIWMTWHPSGASAASLSIASVLETSLKLLPASMLLFATPWIKIKVAIILAMLAISAFFVIRKYRSKQLNFTEILMIFVVLACIAEIISVAFGRASQGGWSDGLAMHYAILTALIPVAAWILISKLAGEKFAAIYSIVMIALFAGAYSENYQWRRDNSHSVMKKQMAVQRLLSTEPDSNAVIDKFPLDFTWRDIPDAKAQAKSGLALLRDRNFVHYTATVPFAVMPGAGGTLSEPVGLNVVSSAQIEVLKGWVEAGDYDRTTLKNYTVFGSHIVSDADTGTLIVNVRRGQRLYYRSGPHTSSQTIALEIGGKSIRYPLPVLGAWSAIEFSGESLPDSFQVSFHDDGNTWGEWSAIALGGRVIGH